MKRIAQITALLIALGLLTGCLGGGDAFVPGSDNAPAVTEAGLSVSLELVDQARGTATTSISATSPGELRATVTQNGSPLASAVVSFSTEIGELSPPSGTALTDASGVATITLQSGDQTGAGTVTASVTAGEETATAEVSFQILAAGTTTTTVDMGNGTGSNFVSGVIDIGGITSLSAGGTLTATVSIVDTSNNNAAYTSPVTVSFSSTCVSAGSATMDAVVTTVNGIASSTYLAQGCTGNDVIVATAVVGGTTYTASAGFSVLAAEVGSIGFVSATPGSIALQGTGGSGLSESSVVVFRVLDAQGDPVPNQSVNFSLSTAVGGISLSPSSAVTDQSGQVQTVVQAGTVATSVGVIATTVSAGKTFQTQSSQLVITTGIPDQDSFSLSASVLAPEAWGYDGEEVTITARLADRFNNPVPDGTAVTFTTEGGSIDGSCTTVDGECSVTWRSQAPRPCGQRLGAQTVTLNPLAGPNVCEPGTTTNPSVPQPGTAPLGQPYGGRVTILATVVGEESFIDTNGNGIFDDGDTMADLPHEAWLDEDEDGVRGTYEPFLDFDASGTHEGAPDGKFNGVLCERTTAPLCSTNQLLHVRQSLVLVMSGSQAFIDVVPDASIDPMAACNGTIGFTVRYSDLHNQPMPAGTRVDVSTTYGTISSGNSFTQTDTNGNFAISFRGVITGTGSPGSGTLTVTVTTPKNIVSTADFPVSCN